LLLSRWQCSLEQLSAGDSACGSKAAPADAADKSTPSSPVSAAAADQGSKNQKRKKIIIFSRFSP